MQIYLAGPLFSTAEKDYNLKLAKQFEKAGFEVFLPQRDGVLAKQSPYDKMPKDERRKTMFELDRDQIIGSEIFVYILDGRVPDEGAAVELGIAYMSKISSGKPLHIIGLHTDERAAFMGARLNPMLNVPLEFIADDEQALLDHLKTLS